ncbi:hypothetical protein LTT66_18395 [Nocardia gipuzkoensis]|uniref:putative phage holin n=1 Tax=Nocardia gipuzkoensis TaxID=2749991 RepID=UPI001E3FFDC0|nr:hypothetical protein [Nocardia gipuzkoensis]UGT65341.1 hypothetical protein LTT66_18395 [Nocardia gipuzkoensis]
MSIRKNHVVLAVSSAAGIGAYFLAPNRETVVAGYLAAIALLGWIFVLTYGVRSHWRATAAGRGVMRLMLCLTLICTQGMATILSDYSYPGRDIIRPLLLLGVALAILDLLLTLVRIQRERGDR